MFSFIGRIRFLPPKVIFKIDVLIPRNSNVCKWVSYRRYLPSTRGARWRSWARFSPSRSFRIGREVIPVHPGDKNLKNWLSTTTSYLGGSPGQVVMGGDSCSKGREFESQHCILNGHFSHLFVAKILMCVWKDENKWKRGRGWTIC